MSRKRRLFSCWQWKARKELRWEPKTKLGQGLSKIINQDDMQAIIIAGGKGTRIQSVSRTVPKVLFPISGKPLLGHLIDHLKENGISELAIPKEIIAVEKLPLLGTGKTDYVEIKNMVS